MLIGLVLSLLLLVLLVRAGTAAHGALGPPTTTVLAPSHLLPPSRAEPGRVGALDRRRGGVLMGRVSGRFGQWWEHVVVPRIVESYCGAPDVARARQRVTAGLHGDVVEIGFGSGLNVPHLPERVTHLHAVEPESTGQRLGAERIAASKVPISFVGLDGQQLPLDDASMDAALCTFTLCTIPDAGRALAELRRVLRPGGTFHFLEHGLAPDPGVARWQRRLTPIQRRVCGGCHFDRAIDQLITASGFEITDLTTTYRAGPKVPGFVYEGVAVSR